MLHGCVFRKLQALGDVIITERAQFVNQSYPH